MGILAAFMVSILVFTMMVTSHVSRTNIEAQNQKLVDDHYKSQQKVFDTQKAKYKIFEEVESRENEVPHYMQGYWVKNGPLSSKIYYINESHLTEYTWSYSNCYKPNHSTYTLLYNSEMDREAKYEDGVYRSLYKDRMVVMKGSHEYRYHFTVEEGVSLVTDEIWHEWRPTTTKFEKIKSYDLEDVKFCY